MTADKQMQAVLDQLGNLGPLPVETLTPFQARNQSTPKDAALNAIREAGMIKKSTLSAPMPVAKIEHILIPGPTDDILARIYTPDGEGPFPVLVYFHGGGFVIADLDVYDDSCRALCNAASCIVVSVAYRLAPEFRYPAAHDDAYAASQWVIKNAAQFNGDPARVAFGGESAGGNLATSCCLRARDNGGVLPVHQLLVYPVVDNDTNTGSYQENAQAKPLNKAMMEWFFKNYTPENGTIPGPEYYLLPLKAPDLKGLPSATVITAEIDPLRDEGEMYAQRLTEAGVPVEFRRFEGVTHEFFSMGAIVDKAKEANEFAADRLTAAFGAKERIPTSMRG